MSQEPTLLLPRVGEALGIQPEKGTWLGASDPKVTGLLGLQHLPQLEVNMKLSAGLEKLDYCHLDH